MMQVLLQAVVVELPLLLLLAIAEALEVKPQARAVAQQLAEMQTLLLTKAVVEPPPQPHSAHVKMLPARVAWMPSRIAMLPVAEHRPVRVMTASSVAPEPVKLELF